MEVTFLYTIARINLSDVKACHFKPEAHTVSLKDDGEWWAMLDEGKIVSVLCVSDKHGGKYFSENYTEPDYRGKGLFTTLLDVVANKVYNDCYKVAHCLIASKGCYKRCGFELFNTRYFKHGTQYYMRKEAKYGKTEN